jgi:hypothetical protein
LDDEVGSDGARLTTDKVLALGRAVAGRIARRRPVTVSGVEIGADTFRRYSVAPPPLKRYRRSEAR